MSVNRAAYLREVDIRKEETQLYVPKIPHYKGASYVKLQEFVRACKHRYETRPFTYRSTKDKVMLVKGNLQDSPRGPECLVGDYPQGIYDPYT